MIPEGEAMNRYEVKAIIQDIDTPILVVEAIDEWMARTEYMASTTLKLKGQFVDWDIKEL